MEHSGHGSASAGPTPLITVGVPVYNGAMTVGSTIDSVLAQTFTAFELIIADNASVDDTRAVCMARAAHDPRIRYVRHETNRGPIANFRFLVDQARTPFFMWLAADDCLRPNFLAANHAVLAARPHVVASIGLVRMGERYAPSAPAIGAQPLSGDYGARLRAYLADPALNSRFYSLFRREAIANSFVDAEFLASDWATIANVLRHGEFHQIAEVLSERSVAGESSRPIVEQIGGLRLGRPRSFMPLADFTAWLWRTLPRGEFLRCAPVIARLNVWKTSKMLYEMTPVPARRAARRAAAALS